MNRSDHYQDLLLYLEQTKDEITQVFENDDRKFSPPPPIKEKEINDEDIELDFLIQLNETIKSDISELLAKNDLNEITITDHQFYNNNIENNINGFAYIHDNELYENGHFDEKHLSETDTLSDILGSDSIGHSINLSEQNAINAATQTCPSLSISSTNLTWASECSSSPCLTSTSDSDLLDEDAQSSSSTDGRDHLLVTWSSKPGCQLVLGTKSSSAPVLKRGPNKVNKQSRSQSDRHLAEIEAAEACRWLRATGFPQYAQLYEDMQFPIDVATAAHDHPLLEPEILHSLFRRLQILNSCAHLHQQRVTHTDESEDEYCALSDNWTYQTDIRRWSRTCNKIPPQNFEEANKRLENISQEKDDVFEKSTASPKDRLRRAGSTKFRRRRDGVLFSDRQNVLESISQQLSDIKSREVNHVSDSEITPRHTRRTRTKSFDKTETWSHSHTTPERVIWQKLPEHEVRSPERKVFQDNNGPPFSHLSSGQLKVLRTLALLKLTAHIEKYCPSHRTGWSWDLPKWFRKIKPSPDYKDKNVFGVPLTITFQRTGQVLPRNIEEAMRWLHENAADQVGIFRKPGVKSRIQALRNMVEANVGVDYTDQQCYDVADMVKQYFRELPEALLTNKLSETFILIFQYVPPYLRRESVLCALLSMPEEHVEVLQALLHFLLNISKHSEVNQMNESNLAMCFAPSLFHYSQAYKQNLGSPHPKELAENKAGHECLLYLMKNFSTLFRIPQEFLNQCLSGEIGSKAKLLDDLGRDIGGWRKYLKDCQTNLLKESREKCRGWESVPQHNPKVEISYKIVADGVPLKLWKVSAEIEAPPSEVLHRILRERHIWDPDLHSAKIVYQLNTTAEVFQYVRKSISPLPNEEYCIVRMWDTKLPKKDACLVVETSVEHPDVIPVPNTARGVVLASRYLIEPCGSGKSRLLHISRVETLGRAPEWYQRNYGYLCSLFLANIQNSFYQNTVGPETKV